ncbi:hypothetical protein K0M31_015490 [Melipona bicolor]|uniref:Uncharacterized protein n=1 Tax=Melipona bicolor TaxID=60889 RepID=A0AA40FFF4_9HYME|nr:hypothetical protein K0M31_015490 [Melipona bicolor]
MRVQHVGRHRCCSLQTQGQVADWAPVAQKESHPVAGAPNEEGNMPEGMGT